MAPPERSDEPAADGVAALEEARLDDSRMRPNAARLAAWVEWLLHPEEHEYDRTVIYPDGTKREEPGRVTMANPTPGQFEPIERDFESVVAQYPLVAQYLDGMAAFSTQRVEAHDSVLSFGAAAIRNVWWLGDAHMTRLVHDFPDGDEWSGKAARAADRFIGDMSVIVTQLVKIAQEFVDVGPQYAVIVKEARNNFDAAAAALVTAFEDKFHTKTAPAPIDIAGIALTAVTAGLVTYMSGGLLGPVLQDAALAAWAAMFTDAAGKLTESNTNHGTVDGARWIELAQTYMRTQAEFMDDAVTAINGVNQQLVDLIDLFDDDKAGPGPLLEKYR
ncbi:hypothetical protein [Actinophytocola xinjiangensis]|uniref:hypothetical protein n=1 Tax=Actinophytocola xinjiangensis TaxID=485602 RepID=UPI000AC93C8D|nr:hypothetical protein [Actinophytocola xinjiangensis]